MSDVAVAILIASLSTLGSWLVQVYLTRTTRRDVYNEKRLVALLEVRQSVEQAGGRWYGWASKALSGGDLNEAALTREKAEQATHEAWYATRVFEMYFPTMMLESQLMRDEISRRRDLAHHQVEVTGTFNRSEFSDHRTIDLDEVVRKSRKILGYPDE